MYWQWGNLVKISPSHRPLTKWRIALPSLHASCTWPLKVSCGVEKGDTEMQQALHWFVWLVLESGLGLSVAKTGDSANPYEQVLLETSFINKERDQCETWNLCGSWINKEQTPPSLRSWPSPVVQGDSPFLFTHRLSQGRAIISSSQTLSTVQAKYAFHIELYLFHKEIPMAQKLFLISSAYFLI